jgi:4-hydroxy-tetrahydrodipicolinate synthase
MDMEFEARGVIPALLLPFDENYDIDEPAYRRHVEQVGAVRDIAALTVNGHSQEVHALDGDEQKQVLDITLDVIGDRLPIVAGVYHDGSAQAARLARAAQEHGASALLVFPPHPLIAGGQLKPSMAIAHYEMIADASDLPIVAFQYSLESGQGYTLDTLVRLAEAVPSIVAIKDWCGNVQRHELHIRTLHDLPRKVNVLSTHSAWLLSSLVLGCDGLLSGAGSVMAALQVELFRSIQARDLTAALAVNERISPLATAFYTDPYTDMHNRMKEALVLLGQLPSATVRRPLTKLSPAEVDRIERALICSGLLSGERRLL